MSSLFYIIYPDPQAHPLLDGIPVVRPTCRTIGAITAAERIIEPAGSAISCAREAGLFVSKPGALHQRRAQPPKSQEHVKRHYRARLNAKGRAYRVYVRLFVHTGAPPVSENGLTRVCITLETRYHRQPGSSRRRNGTVVTDMRCGRPLWHTCVKLAVFTVLAA